MVFVSITAPSTADAVARFIELAPPEMRKAVQNAMAESFRGAVGTVLLKKAGGGLVAAREVLLATAPVTRLIGEGQVGQLPLVLESGRKHGMVSFTEALAEYVRSGAVDVRERAPERGPVDPFAARERRRTRGALRAGRRGLRTKNRSSGQLAPGRLPRRATVVSWSPPDHRM